MWRFVLAGWLTLLSGSLGSAQPASSPPFTYSYTMVPGTGNATPVFGGGAISFAVVQPGAISSVHLALVNAASDVWQVSSASVIGNPFSITSFTPGPVQPRGALEIDLQFFSATAASAGGALTIRFAHGADLYAVVFTLAGQARTPGVTVGYQLNAVSTPVTLQAGEPIPLPRTPLGQTQSISIIVSNLTTEITVLEQVAVTGSAFSASNIPILPSQLQPNQQLRFALDFTPAAAQTYSGQLTVRIGGVSSTYNISGTGATASLATSVIQSNGTATPAQPGGLISFPAVTLPGGSSRVTVRITNTGNLDGRVSSVVVDGSAYKLSGLDVLPVVVPGGGAISFVITFAPNAIGETLATLAIDNAVYTLAGTASGPQLNAVAILGATRAPIDSATVIALPNTPVGRNYVFAVEIGNSGNADGTVMSISAGGRAFSVTSRPSLPATISPGGSVTFLVAFAPAGIGDFTGTVTVDAISFGLKGTGTTPAEIPQVTILGLPTPGQPLQQPLISVQLDSPYSAEITGTLNLSFLPSAFADDASILFSNGSRQVAFRIPAGTTEAQFAPGIGKVALQTGSLAGALTVTAALAVGAIDMTPVPAPAASSIISAGPPFITGVRLGSITASSFELLISGLATGRSLQKLTFTFMPGPGVILQKSTLSLDVADAFKAWYSSSTAKQYGSQFTLSVLFNISVDPGVLTSVGVLASNELGDSNAAIQELSQNGQ
jgi:hypothetical protein